MFFIERLIWHVGTYICSSIYNKIELHYFAVSTKKLTLQVKEEHTNFIKIKTAARILRLPLKIIIRPDFKTPS